MVIWRFRNLSVMIKCMTVTSMLDRIQNSFDETKICTSFLNFVELMLSRWYCVLVSRGFKVK